MPDPTVIDEHTLLVGVVRASRAQVERFTAGRPIALVSDIIYDEALTRGIDPAFAVAESILETGWGRSPLAQRHHNWFGFEAYYEDPGRFRRFPDDRTGIQVPLEYMRAQYFAPGGTWYREGAGKTLSGWAQKWIDGPPAHWGAAVRQLMLLMGTLVQITP